MIECNVGPQPCAKWGGKKSHHTSTISHPPEQRDMVLVGFFYLLSPGVMMREVWPATLIMEGCAYVCVCVCG